MTEPAMIDPRVIDKRNGKMKVINKKVKSAIKLILTGECKTVGAVASTAIVAQSTINVAEVDVVKSAVTWDATLLNNLDAYLTNKWGP